MSSNFLGAHFRLSIAIFFAFTLAILKKVFPFLSGAQAGVKSKAVYRFGLLPLFKKSNYQIKNIPSEVLKVLVFLYKPL